MGKYRIVGLFAGVSLGAGAAVAPGVRADEAQIQTVFASYGYAAERKDVKEDVAKYCDGKPSCTFMVGNDSFAGKAPADPSPGNDKGLLVAWKCGSTQHKTQFAEGRKATMDCQ